jgi:hypothetical protein
VQEDHIRQQKQPQVTFQAQQQWEAQYAQIACDAQLASEMQDLDYSQSNTNPEQI